MSDIFKNLNAERTNGIYMLGVEHESNPSEYTYRVKSAIDEVVVESVRINGNYIGGMDFELECDDYMIDDGVLKIEVGCD